MSAYCMFDLSVYYLSTLIPLVGSFDL